jgi:hypothetical protein
MAALTLLAGLGCGGSSVRACPEAAAIRQQWVRASDQSGNGHPSAKHELAAELVRCHVFVGRTKSQVRRLVGNPSSIWPGGRGQRQTLLWEYYTGPDPTSPSGGTTLVLRFGDETRVVDATTLS